LISPDFFSARRRETGASTSVPNRAIFCAALATRRGSKTADQSLKFIYHLAELAGNFETAPAFMTRGQLTPHVSYLSRVFNGDA